MKQIVSRVLISLIGLALILYGIGSLVLSVVGEKDTAVLTSIRRQGGERNESIRGRYTYIMGYTFTLPDGRRIDGSATLIRDAVYVKANGASTIPIRYLKVLPIINAPENDTLPSIGQPLLVGLGVFLIYAVRGKKQIPEEEQ